MKDFKKNNIMTTLSILTFNLEYGGELTTYGKKYKQSYDKFINQYVTSISKFKPDIISFQEILFNNDKLIKNNRATTSYAISNALQYYYYESVNNGLAIASKYPIKKIFDKEYYCGIEIDINNKLFRIFNLHLNHEPCAHFSLQNIPYSNTPKNLTPAEAAKISAKDKLPVLRDILKNSNKNTFIMGDFNETSHLDWNEKAVKHGIVPCEVKWVISSYLSDNNFTDIIRKKYNCNIKYPMNTCDVIRKSNIKNAPARIDFIYTNAKIKHITKACTIPLDLSDHLPVFVKLHL